MSQKKLRIIHIEDEKDARITLKKMVEKFITNAEVINFATTLEEGISLVENEKFDLLFLDLQLPDGNGFYIAEKYTSITSKTILTTADDSRGIDALKKGITDYLVKPYTINELQESIEKFRLKITNSKNIKAPITDNEKLAIPDINGIRFVNFKHIIRLESDGNYTRIFLQNESKDLYVSKTLKTFETLLAEKKFLRVHQSHLINFNFIYRLNKLDGGNVELIDGTIIKTSASGRKILKSQLGL
ncbi:MAG: response regulator transcription factor [Flavobacteriales bacterium]|nr:response regulator transcription factor [Flavobacteriales bacterium]NQX96669.1 response regulator transcription factor [Flavobacteriales bacterium]